MGDLTLYEPVRPQMKTGDVIQWSNNTVMGWLIRTFSKANVNHSSLVIRLSEYQGLQNRRFQLEALSRGIVLNLVSSELKGYGGKAWWYPLDPQFDDLRPKIASWAFNHVGVPYDFESLFKQSLCRVSSDAKKLFCSEFCYLAWREAGIKMPEQKFAPRPGDIPQLNIFLDPVRIK